MQRWQQGRRCEQGAGHCNRRARVPVKTLPPNQPRQLWLEVEAAHKGWSSLKGLRGAMDAMRLSHADGHQGARVAQVALWPPTPPCITLPLPPWLPCDAVQPPAEPLT